MSIDESVLTETRREFSTLAKGVHLVSHSLGPIPRAARRYAAQFLDEWENDSIGAWHRWLPAVRELGDLIADVIGVDHGTVAVMANVSNVQAAVASCFAFNTSDAAPFRGRTKIVYDALNFSTVHYVWQEQVRRGAELVVVNGKNGVDAPIDELIAAIDERTLLVPISHVLFRSSAMYDAKRVIDHAHKMGAMVLLDCYQSAGVVPLHLKEWGCDMACGGSVKWACGGPGAAYLYVRPDLLPLLRPMSAGWFSHEEPFAFDMGPMRYADDVWRMIGGTPAIPSIYTARAGWEMVRKLGVEAIRKKSLRQTALLRKLVEERGHRVNTPREDDARGGTICFDFEGAEKVSQALSMQNLFHDYRPNCGIRVSPHFFTIDDEISQFVAEVDRATRAA